LCGDSYRFRAVGADETGQKNRFLPADFSAISPGGATGGVVAVCKTEPTMRSQLKKPLRHKHFFHPDIVK
jgi:hypothetical protein